MRVAIQNKILEVCRGGVFPKVTYNKTTQQATVSDSIFLTPNVVVNETAAALSSSVAGNARSSDRTMDGWNFEARLKFTSEVSTYQFLTQELKRISFTHDNTRVVINSIGQPIEHPPQQGSHNGTQLVLTFSVKTKT